MIINKSCLYPKNDLVSPVEESIEDQLILEDKENEKYRLRDYYCKHEDCNCTNVKFSVFLNAIEISEIYYDYQQAKILAPSDYSFLITEIEHIADFNEYLSVRHEVVRGRFESLVLEQEILHLEKEIQQLKLQAGAKIGRNEPCPCDSGLKYKKCCLRK